MKRPSPMRLTALVAASAAAGAFVLPGLAAGSARSTSGTTASASASAAATAMRVHTAMMTGTQEVPGPGDPDGMGRATITGDPSTGEVCWDLQVANITLPAAAAHIHVGAPGVAGPIIVALTPPDANGVSSGCTTQKDPASGGGTLTGADVQSILTNPAGFYVNVHTSDFPTGAIRGQLTTGLNSAGAFYALPSPLRAYDSRTVTGTGGTTGTTSTTTGTTSTTTGTGTTSTGSKLTTNEVRTIDLSMGRDGTGQMQVAVPAGASAVQITLTITETDATGGFVTAYPSALAQRPATSSINWKTANMDLATTLTIALDARGTIKLSGFGSTHVIVDVLGFYY